MQTAKGIFINPKVLLAVCSSDWPILHDIFVKLLSANQRES